MDNVHFQDRGGRRSIRLKNYNYSSDGHYFITVCSYKKKPIFGKVKNGKIILNELGKFIEFCWFEIPNHFTHATTDEFCIMPNHWHGIIVIQNKASSENKESESSPGFIKVDHEKKKPRGTSRSIGSIVRGLKTGVTRWAIQNTDIQKVWQRNYYEHVIETEESLWKLREYIRHNPLNWKADAYFDSFAGI